MPRTAPLPPTGREVPTPSMRRALTVLVAALVGVVAVHVGYSLPVAVCGSAASATVAGAAWCGTTSTARDGSRILQEVGGKQRRYSDDRPHG